MTLDLLSPSLLQAATHPHGHHLGVAVVELDDEGVILEKRERERVTHGFVLHRFGK